MAAKPLASVAAADVRSLMDAATSDPKGIPGAVLYVVNKEGKPIFTHASGRRGVETTKPMDLDTVFWIASCTKMIAGIACMQMVEKGQLRLDDADQVEEVCPELKAIKILKGNDANGKPILVEKKNRITLRMLLSHTAGFGYSFFNHELKAFGNPIGLDELCGLHRDIYASPLVFEPGTAWQYGIGIDWAGEMVMRVSGLSLNDYMHQHIFNPLGLENITMYPTDDMKANLAHMHARQQDGTLVERDHMLRLPLIIVEEHKNQVFNSGGAGCFARPSDYAQIIATLLNNGTSPTTGAQILLPSTVDEMFTNQIPNFPDFGRQGIPASKPDHTNAIPDIYPQPGLPQGWGLTFMLTISPSPVTGRAGNTGWWAGLPNLFWWADRERGVGGIIATQILPFADPNVLDLWIGCEQKIYASLEA